MQIRPYRPSDLPAVQRIWKECGWVDSDEEAAALEHLFADAAGVVATMDDEAECSGTSHTGVIDFDGRDLPLSGVTSITTSRRGRKQGLAKAVTAHLLSDAAERGAAVALLGIFEQGFYDRGEPVGERRGPRSGSVQTTGTRSPVASPPANAPTVGSRSIRRRSTGQSSPGCRPASGSDSAPMTES